MYCSGRNTILRLTEYILHKSEIYVHANKNSQTDLIELPWRVQKQLFNQFWSLLKYFYSTCISCGIWTYLENTFQSSFFSRHNGVWNFVDDVFQCKLPWTFVTTQCGVHVYNCVANCIDTVFENH